MGFMGLLKFALLCTDYLAWPVIAIGYPLLASIRAVETDSKYHMRKLVIYWTIVSIISLFEYAFVKIIEWIPFWSSIKLVAIFWLVIPRFHGACYAYQSLLRPYLVVKLQEIIKKHDIPNEEQPHNKKEAFLNVVEENVQENTSEALEKPIENKVDTQAATTTEQIKEPNAAHKDNEMPAAPEKTNPKQEKNSAANAKDTTPSTPPPSIGEPPEWTCPLCQVTTTCEKNLNDHLRGKRHKSMCESLKSSKFNGKGKSSPDGGKKKAGEGSKKNSSKRTEAKVQNRGSSEQSGLSCDVCNVKVPSKIHLASHLKGKRHASNVEQTVKG